MSYPSTKSIERAEPDMPSVIAIQRAVGEYFRVPVSELRSQTRKRGVAQPRMIAMSLCCEMTALSLPQIGHLFDRDHTTVIHARRAVIKLTETPYFNDAITHLRDRLASTPDWREHVRLEKLAAEAIGEFAKALEVTIGPEA